MRHVMTGRIAGLAVMLAVAGSAGAATPAPVGDSTSIEGAQGSQWPMVSTFDTAPVRAKPAPGSACEVADRYVSLQAAGRQPELPALYALDADLLSVESDPVHGRPALTEYYKKSAPRQVTPISFVDKGRECFMELASVIPGDVSGKFKLTAINHFTLNEERLIKRLVIYIRPGLMK